MNDCAWSLEISRSHFILSDLNYYVLTLKNKYNVLIVLISYCKHFAAVVVDMGKVRDRFGGMGDLRVA